MRGLENPKLSNQRAGPFTVLEAHGHLAFRLDLPPIRKIHPIISIAMLESASGEVNSYSCQIEIDISLVENMDENDNYEIERTLDRRITTPESKTQERNSSIID